MSFAADMSIPSSSGLLDFPMLFEIGWEVANKSGGIYTVLRTKVPVTVEEYGDRYCLIGPYIATAAAMEFEEIPPPKPLAGALKKMESQGVVLHFGRWLVPGNPHALLFELGPVWSRIDGWRQYVRCLLAVLLAAAAVEVASLSLCERAESPSVVSPARRGVCALR